MLAINILSSLDALHVTGTLDDPSKNFFLFLAKFGFQKTGLLNKNETQGYIYGNITYVNENGGSENQFSHQVCILCSV